MSSDSCPVYQTMTLSLLPIISITLCIISIYAKYQNRMAKAFKKEASELRRELTHKSRPTEWFGNRFEV